MPRRPLVCFDTNLTAVRGVRRWWGTLCETAGQPLFLTPTASNETLRRVQFEVERETQKALRARRSEGEHISPRYIRRVATTAGNIARDAMKDKLRQQGSAYLETPEPGDDTLEMEIEIDESIPEDAFDRNNDNSVRDRKIVVEAAARGYDILASNNVNSMRRGILDFWSRTEGRNLGLEFKILTPDDTEEQGEEEADDREYEQPAEGMSHGAALHRWPRKGKVRADQLPRLDG